MKKNKPYSYEEVATIIVNCTGGKSYREVAALLDRSAGSVCLVKNQYKSFLNNDGVYAISVPMLGYFKQYVNENRTKHNSHDKIAKDKPQTSKMIVKEDISEEVAQEQVDSGENLVKWYKEGYEIIEAYVKEEVAKRTQEMQKELSELREYRKKTQEALRVFYENSDSN